MQIVCLLTSIRFSLAKKKEQKTNQIVFGWGKTKKKRKNGRKRKSCKYQTHVHRPAPAQHVFNVRVRVCECGEWFCVFIFQVHVNWKSFKHQTINEIPIFCSGVQSFTRAPAIYLFLSHICELSGSLLSAVLCGDSLWGAIFSRCFCFSVT